jgi:pectinesterase
MSYISILIALAFLALPLSAQEGPQVDINISGRVTDGNNKVISGAVVTLENAKLTDTTDNNGAFTLSHVAKSGIPRNSPLLSHGLEAAMHQNILSLNVPKQSLVTITAYSLLGKEVSRIQKNLSAGSHRLVLRSAETNIQFYKVALGSTEIILKGVSMGAFQQGAHFWEQWKVTTPILKKMTAAPAPFNDMLKVVKSGYENFSLRLTNPKMIDMAIQLKPKKTIKPDIVVAKDGSGDFTKVEAAINSVSKGNKERKIIYIKNGVYNEHIRMEGRSFVTLLGEDRYKTKILFKIEDPRNDKTHHNDGKGIATFNIVNCNDVVLDNLTIENPANMGLKPFTLYGQSSGTRIIVQNADILGLGGDTFSLWTNGMYYHNNIYVTGTYNFMGPRGTTYMVNSIIEPVGVTKKACFNEGNRDQRQKFVLHRVKFQSKFEYGMGSYFRDAAWYFVGCEFDSNLVGGIWLESKTSLRWGKRVFFADCKGPKKSEFFQDNISSSPIKTASAVTSAWTFWGQWDPESKASPKVGNISSTRNALQLTFNESVTVKGSPSVSLADGSAAPYFRGSGSKTIFFITKSKAEPRLLKLNGGAIIASEASSQFRSVPDSFELRNIDF